MVTTIDDECDEENEEDGGEEMTPAELDTISRRRSTPDNDKQIQALQEQYLAAMVRRNVGFGKKTEKLALYLANTGLEPGEVMALLDAVYNPTNPEGLGQATRAKYFGEALVKIYGEVYLHNVGQNYKAFLGFAQRVREAVDMRDSVNDRLRGAGSIAFKDTLKLQALGQSSASILDNISRLQSDYGLTTVRAIMKVKDAIENVESANVGNLEAILFFNDATAGFNSPGYTLVDAYEEAQDARF